MKHHPPRRSAPKDANDGPVRLFGIHAVEAALRNPARTIGRLLLTDNAERRLEETLRTRKVKGERIVPRDLDRLLGADTVHQGAMLETEPLPEPSLEEIAQAADRGGPIVVLDQVTDPHNVGAVLRSAAAFGASGLVMTRRHSPPLNGTLAKSASGALEVVPIALVPNLARSLAEMGELGLLRVGLDGEAERLIEDQPLDRGIALIVGAEGKGLRQLTRDLCDTLCRIGTDGAISSLNVSNAAAVALHLAAMQRRKAKPNPGS
jgi:23S rRNA (guanosine2251-2'-O)-methyltransferase